MTDHDELYEAGCDLVWPFLHLDDQVPEKLTTFQAGVRMAKGILMLEGALEMRPDNWATYWILGKAFESNRDNEQSYARLKRAFEINPQHVDVNREFMLSCLRLGKSGEAVVVAENAVKLAADNPGLVANLALALLVDGQLDRALSEATRAVDLAPDDVKSQSLLRGIRDVIEGKRAMPTRWPDES